MRGHLADVLLENLVDTEFLSPVGSAAYRRVCYDAQKIFFCAEEKA